MEYRKCLVCDTPFEPESYFCTKCGAKFDEQVLEEARSINYMIREINDWPRWLTIRQETQQKLFDHYQNRLAYLTNSLKRVGPAPAIKEEAPPPLIHFTETQIKVEEPIIHSALEVVFSETPAAALSQPSVAANIVTPPRPKIPTAISPIQSAIQVAPATANNIEEEIVRVETPRRSLSELVAENIKLIFAISAALFVGGVLLYYRNAIYLGLKQPWTQAFILGFATIGCIVGGWTLVRRTNQTLAGRTLTLVGSLLVPINPWFLVRSGLIPESGNGWILGLACTALYAWTAYFLRERLYVYLALATGIITGWSAVYKFTGGAQTSAYSIVLMAFSLAYLLAERFFKSKATDESGIDFSIPFFHVAQVGIALSLLFYTPLVAFVPGEFLAAKRYFDPHGYSGLNTIWLSLCATFAYFYSGMVRHNRAFIYLSIIAGICAEAAILHNIDVTLPTAVVAYASTALLASIVSRYGIKDDLYAAPLIQTSILAAFGLLAVAAVSVFLLTIGNPLIPGWRMLASFVVAALIFAIESKKDRTPSAICATAALIAIVGLFVLVKLSVPNHLISIIFLVPVYALLLLGKRYQQQQADTLFDYFQTIALVLTGCVIAGSIINAQVWVDHKIFLSILSMGIAAAFAISARQTEDETGRAVQIYASILFGGLSYMSLLKSTNLELKTRLPLETLYPMGLLGLVVAKTGLFGDRNINAKRGLADQTEVFRISAFVLAFGIAAFCLVANPFPDGGLRFVLLMAELATFFLVSGFNSNSETSRSLQFYLSILFTTISYGGLARVFPIADYLFLPVMMAVPYSLMALSSTIPVRKHDDIDFETTDPVSGSALPQVQSLRTALINMSALTTLLGLVFLVAGHPTAGHRITTIILLAEFAGLFVIFGYKSQNKTVSYPCFISTLVFSTLSFVYVIRLFAVNAFTFPYSSLWLALSTWALILYSVSLAQPNLRVEFGKSLSLVSTVLTAGLFLIALGLLGGWYVFPSEIAPRALILPLLIILAKEVIHTVKSRWALHSALSGLIGFLLIFPFFQIAETEFKTTLLWLDGICLVYLLSAHIMRQLKIEHGIYLPLEIISNLVIALVLILTFIPEQPFELRSCFSAAAVATFCGLAAVSRRAQTIGKAYAHGASALCLVTCAMLLNHFGFGTWSALSGVLLPLLSLSLVVEYFTKDSVFKGAIFNVAQIALPVVAILGLWDGFNAQVVPLQSALFFAEISVFYLLSALQRKLHGFLYPALGAFGIAFWYLLANFSTGVSTSITLFAILGFVLYMLARELKRVGHWAAETIGTCGHVTLIGTGICAVGNTLIHMRLNNAELNPIIVTLLTATGISIAIGVIERNSDARTLYRAAAILLAILTYITIGIRLGYDLTKQTEFYSLPVGTVFLLAGYVQAKRQRKLASFWLWTGSLLLSVPLLLHALQYRFINHQSSSQYDIGILVVSLILILGGILAQLKAPTITGGTSFLTSMSVIVFSFVDWEQKTLSLSMIVLALVLFVSSWIIYTFYKRNQLGAIGRQSKQVIEQFGKWK